MRRTILILAATAAALLGAAAPAFADDAIEGTRTFQTVGTFQPPGVPKQVTIDWGDGTPKDTASVDQPDAKSPGVVMGSHVYAKFGFYAVKVVNANNPDNSTSSYITVKDAPVTAVGANFKVAASGGGVVLASVTDSNPLGNPADFTATVDWGDGTTTAGTIAAAGGPGLYTVTGAHAYGDAASHLAGVTIKSSDGGDANVQVQATGDGAADPPATATPGGGDILNFGKGDSPTLVTEDDGTADLAWSISAPGRTGDSIVYCRLPRGAKTCAIKRTFVVDALTGPKILKDRAGVLHIVISYNGPLQLGGGTLVMSSPDQGNTWGYQFFHVNTGLFQGSVIDAAMSLDGRTLYGLFGDFLPGDISGQTLAAMRLDTGTLTEFDSPGIIGGVKTYSARTIATLPDGRLLMAGYDTGAFDAPDPTKVIPRAAVRVVADASGNLIDQPWVPIRGGVVDKLAANATGASIIAQQQCQKGVDVLPIRGTTVGAARQIGSERFLACNTDEEDLSYDAGGGRHAVFLSDHDGCAGSKQWDDSEHTCLIYRYARPGADWGPKSTVTHLSFVSARGLTVSAGKDGQGWITYADLGTGGIFVIPTSVESEQPIDATHRIALSVKPSAECSTSGKNTVSVQVVGPSKGAPKVTSVKWSTNPKGLLPRSQPDSKAPFSISVETDKKLMRNIGSTGDVVLSIVLQADVKYTVGGKKQSTKLKQTLSYYCNIPWDKVKPKGKK